jgi:hypothetical protein
MPLMMDSTTHEALPSSAQVEKLLPKVEYRWGSIFFISLITVATLVFCPIYLWQHGLTKAELAFFAFYALASSFSISLGYHRLFSHVAFKAAWPIRLLVLIFGGGRRLNSLRCVGRRFIVDIIATRIRTLIHTTSSAVFFTLMSDGFSSKNRMSIIRMSRISPRIR